MAKTYHSLGFLMHQSPDIFSLLMENDMGRLLQIINSYQMPLKIMHTYSDVVRIHVGFSGILLEQLLSNEVIDACRKIIDIPLMLNEYRESKNVEVIGLGYSHPIFPLIPVMDWDSQIAQGKEIIREVFGKEPKGFWPSEMKFCLEMIPVLKNYGYEYVVLDHELVDPIVKDTSNNRYKKESHFSTVEGINYHGIEIAVVTINKDFDCTQKNLFLEEGYFPLLDNEGFSSQKSRLMVDWICLDELQKVNNLLKGYEVLEEYISVYLEQIYSAEIGLKGILLKDYINGFNTSRMANFLANNYVTDFQTDYASAYHEDWPSGRSRAIEAMWQLSKKYHEIRYLLLKRGDRGLHHDYIMGLFEEAHKWLLRSQTSCYFSTDESWYGLYDHMKPGLILLNEVKRQIV